jgi:hypothetical protein
LRQNQQQGGKRVRWSSEAERLETTTTTTTTTTINTFKLKVTATVKHEQQ